MGKKLTPVRPYFPSYVNILVNLTDSMAMREIKILLPLVMPSVVSHPSILRCRQTVFQTRNVSPRCLLCSPSPTAPHILYNHISWGPHTDLRVSLGCDVELHAEDAVAYELTVRTLDEEHLASRTVALEHCVLSSVHFRLGVGTAVLVKLIFVQARGVQ